jgi:predicted nucleotidyltransferase
VGKALELDDAMKAEIVNRLRAVMPVERIVLFGSYARGDYHEASDVDLVVVASSAGDMFERTRPALRALSGCAGRLDIEPHVYTATEYHEMLKREIPLVLRAESEGVVLYEQ